MTIEEAKELLPIIQAYVEGKTVQYEFYTDIWKDIKEPSFRSDVKYRIKPEQKYRPFKTKEECWDEMMKHQPFGWVKDNNGSYLNMMIVTKEESEYANLLESTTFADCAPFGMKEE